MKVVRINKNYRNGTKEHFLVLDEPYSNDDINYLVEEWCENEPSGMNYGYNYDWRFIEDGELINNILKDNIEVIDDQIEVLKTKKLKWENHLK